MHKMDSRLVEIKCNQNLQNATNHLYRMHQGYNVPYKSFGKEAQVKTLIKT